MLRSISRALVVAVLLTALAAPMAEASRPGAQRFQESEATWIDTALSWLAGLLAPKSSPAGPSQRIEVRNATGSCIDPQGKPIQCGS